MPVTRKQKEEVVGSVKKSIKDATSIVLVNFHGLKVSDAGAFRRKLRESGVKYTVAKKTLATKAFAESEIGGEMPTLEGELGIAFGTNDDVTAPAREIYVFQKKLEGFISIIGGVFEGMYKNKEEMTQIAQIPGMQTLRAQFVNIINSPIQGLVIALSAIADKKV